MAEQNRFTDLVGGLNSDKKKTGESDKPVSKNQTGKEKKPTNKGGESPYRKKYKQGVLRGQLFSKGKSSSTDYDKVTVYIHSEIAHALRVVAAMDKTEMSQLVEDAVLEMLLKSPTGKSTLEQSDV